MTASSTIPRTTSHAGNWLPIEAWLSAASFYSVASSALRRNGIGVGRASPAPHATQFSRAIGAAQLGGDLLHQRAKDEAQRPQAFRSFCPSSLRFAHVVEPSREGHPSAVKE